MNQYKYVFAQLVEFLNNNKFRKLVDKYDGNYCCPIKLFIIPKN
ncbi:MAG: DUF4372 domain-containing protein [Brevinema sp.]